MHWLDVEPSQEIDPVLDCLAFLARQSDRPSSPVLLRAGLALSADGRLPFHQVEPALEQVGMRADPTIRRLKGWPSANARRSWSSRTTAPRSCSRSAIATD